MASTPGKTVVINELYQTHKTRIKARSLLAQNSNCFPLLALPKDVQQLVFKEIFRGGLLQFSQRRLPDPLWNSLPLVRDAFGQDLSTNVVRSTSHKNILRASKEVYLTAIDTYYSTIAVHIQSDHQVAQALPQSIGLTNFKSIRKLRFGRCWRLEDIAEHMPQLTTLYLTNSWYAAHAEGVSRTDSQRDAKAFREIVRDPGADHFPGVEALMHKLPNLSVTGKATVRVLFFDFNDGATASSATAIMAFETWSMDIDFNRDLFTNLRMVRREYVRTVDFLRS